MVEKAILNSLNWLSAAKIIAKRKPVVKDGISQLCARFLVFVVTHKKVIGEKSFFFFFKKLSRLLVN